MRHRCGRPVLAVLFAGISCSAFAPPSSAEPVAIMRCTPDHPLLGQTVMCDASESHDPAGFPIARYLWAGDGDPTVTFDDPRVTLEYPRAGTFQLNMRVFAGPREALVESQPAHQTITVSRCEPHLTYPAAGEVVGQQMVTFRWTAPCAAAWRVQICANTRECRWFTAGNHAADLTVWPVPRASTVRWTVVPDENGFDTGHVDGDAIAFPSPRASFSTADPLTRSNASAYFRLAIARATRSPLRLVEGVPVRCGQVLNGRVRCQTRTGSNRAVVTGTLANKPDRRAIVSYRLIFRAVVGCDQRRCSRSASRAGELRQPVGGLSVASTTAQRQRVYRMCVAQAKADVAAAEACSNALAGGLVAF